MDIDAHIEGLRSNRILTERELKNLCRKVIEILVEESNVQPVRAPVTVCGDIHGQFYDLLNLFKIGGELPSTNYVFLGDFVDRGYHSIETLQLLLCYKVKYPNRLLMIRGNHESRQITLCYGFHEQSLRKYGNPNPWRYCNEVFDYLPIGAIIGGEVVCVHGGLSPELKTIDQIRLIDRRQEIPHCGPFSDLVWSDPDYIDSWMHNARGAGWRFGNKPTVDFCRINGSSLIARAHQLVMTGYQYWFEGDKLVTIWSAPNYCYRCGNDASIMLLDQYLAQSFQTFQCVPESAKSKHYKEMIPYFL